MTSEVLINVSPREVRAALVDEGVLQELFIERANKRGLISNIYKGRVSRVLPGMQRLSTLAWNAPPSCMPPTSSRPPMPSMPRTATSRSAPTTFNRWCPKATRSWCRC
jgi:hypothetical protein